MSRAFWGALFALSVAATLPSSAAAQVGLPVGTEAPDAAVEDLDGNPLRLVDLFEGKPTLLEFWATWCEQCEALQPEMDAVQDQFGDQVNVIAVAVAVAQSQRRVRRHLDQHDPGYPFVWDASGEAVRAYEAPTTAVVVLIDASGKIAYTGVGADQDLVAAVSAVVGAH